MRIFDLEISGSVNLSGSILMNNIQETSSAFKNLVLDENNVISFQSGGLNTISSSFAEFANTASLLIGLVESASYAVTSSYALNVPNVSQYWTESVEGFISRESNVQITGSLDISNLIYGSLLGTASFAVISETASYALNGGGTGGLWTESGDFISRQSDVEITGSLSVSNGITGSILGSSSYALTASYALNGGTGGSTFPFAGGFVSQSYTNEATWSLAHNLNKQYLSVEVYNSDNEIIIPEKIIATNENNIVIYFPVTQSGTALVTYGGNVSTSSYALTASYFDGNIESSSYAISSSYSDYALTASYALNGGGGGTSVTFTEVPSASALSTLTSSTGDFAKMTNTHQFAVYLSGSWHSLGFLPNITTGNMFGELIHYAADEIVGKVDGNTVTQWLDLSGNGYNADYSNAAPVYKTNIVNGLPVLRFSDTTNTYMRINYLLGNAVNSQFTIVVVAKETVSATRAMLSTVPLSGAAQGWSFRFKTSTSLQYYHGGQTPNLSDTMVDQFNIFSIRRNGLDGTTGVNGTEEATTTISSFVPNSTDSYTKIGQEASTATNCLDGDIAEIFIFNTDIGLINLTTVVNYLKTKYNIS